MTLDLSSVAYGVAWSVACAVLLRALLRANVGRCRCAAEGPGGEGLRGQTVLITGANTGIGYETARELAARGARVLLACRSPERAAAARDRLLRLQPGADLACYRLDLASLASVHQCAARLLLCEPRLDVLVNNAGVAALGGRRTADGIVEEMQVNHFGPFLLTLLLLPLLRRTGGARVVTVSSCLHYFGSVDLRRINTEGSYGDVFVYANSKLCNVVFTLELARREAARTGGVRAYCLHPGITHTEVAAHTQWWTRLLFRALCLLCGRSVGEAAQTTVHAAVQGAGDPSGQYYTERRRRTWALLPSTRSARLGQSLWEYSERLVNYNYSDVEDATNLCKKINAAQ